MFHDEITDNDILAECNTFREALRMSWRRGGRTIEQIAVDMLPVTAGLQDVSNMVKNLSRIINPRSPEDKRNLDGDLLIPFMVAAGNSIPLRWLFLQYDRKPAITNEALLEKINGLENLFQSTLRHIHHSARKARTKGLTGGRMSLAAADNYDVPDWLLLEAEHMGGCLYVC